MTQLQAALQTLHRVIEVVKQEEITFLAAAVAYYGFVSLIPLLWLLLAIGTVLGFDLSEQALALVGDMITPAGEDALRDSLESDRATGGGTVIGIALIIWASLRVFRGLNVAISSIYGEEDVASLPRQIVDAVLVLVVIPVAILAATVLGVIVPAFESGPLAAILSSGALVVALAVSFLPIYYLFPDTDVTVREVLPGSLLTGVGWTALAAVFGAYTRSLGAFDLYGVLGAALILVTWLYLGGIIIMVGAVVNAVLGGRVDDDSERIDDEGGERTDPAPDVAELGREVRRLRDDLDEKTVSKSDLEGDLRRYVRRRIRRSKARGWGPYLVLLYGTLMTLGGFYWLDGGWAILAMIVVWLSTLGLYVLMVLFGIGFNAIGVPGRALDWVRDRRS